ncbi:hypothetical protein [Massilia sp. SYSU DXS3249]
MLDLHSPRWAELEGAYGSAAGIPALLEQLHTLPNDAAEEPWPSLWSALAHQGDVYTASFAAVPHVVQALASSPDTAGEVYFHFTAWVEICRQRSGVDIPADLEKPYCQALARLPDLVKQASDRPWDAAFTACALSALAVAKGQHGLAEALLQMSSPETLDDFLDWSSDR